MSIFRFRLFLLLVLPLVLLSAKNHLILAEKTSTLEVKGYVYENDEKAEDAEVRLYQNNKIVQRINIKKGGKFQFILFSGLAYMVEIEKADYVTERIQISTKEKTEFSGKYLYEFRVDLKDIKSFKGVDISNLDFPTALIKYNAEEGEYLHDAVYTEKVRLELKRLKAEAKKQ